MRLLSIILSSKEEETKIEIMLQTHSTITAAKIKIGHDGSMKARKERVDWDWKAQHFVPTPHCCRRSKKSSERGSEVTGHVKKV